MTCPDPVTVLDLGAGEFAKGRGGIHANTMRRRKGDWAVGETWLIKFTTGPASNGSGKVSIGSSAPVNAHGTLSETPCGPAVDDNCTKGGAGFTFHYRVGTSPYPTIPALKANTTYYVALTCDQENAGYTVDFIPPNP